MIQRVSSPETAHKSVFSAYATRSANRRNYPKKHRPLAAHSPEFDGFKCVLFHRANQFEHIRDFGFDLVLAGHMHGGQMRIPGVGGVISPKSSLGDPRSKMLFPTYCSGAFRHRNTMMIVNRGIGNPMLVPRLFNRPEIGIIVLRRLAKDA